MTPSTTIATPTTPSTTIATSTAPSAKIATPTTPSAKIVTTTAPTTSTVETATTASSTSTGVVTASQKKLSKSAYFGDSDSGSSDSDCESYELYEDKGMRLFEVAGLQAALQSVCCKECGGGPVVLREIFP